VVNKVDTELAANALIGARSSANGWFRANCPYCADETGKQDRRMSLGLKPSIAFFQCFKCGVRGRLPDEAPWPAVEEAQPAATVIKKPKHFEPVWTDEAWTSLFLSAPRDYLVGRGLTRETCEQARVGFALEGFYAQRVIVPVLDLDERTWLGFVARDWTNRDELRYRYPKGMQRGKFLYNQVALYVETDEPVMIVEGVFDALPYWPNVVACLGKPGEVHQQLMTEARRPVAVCLDGDAWEEGWALSERLRLDISHTGYVQLPPCTDPGSVDHVWLREEAKRCIRS